MSSNVFVLANQHAKLHLTVILRPGKAANPLAEAAEISWYLGYFSTNQSIKQLTGSALNGLISCFSF